MPAAAARMLELRISGAAPLYAVTPTSSNASEFQRLAFGLGTEEFPGRDVDRIQRARQRQEFGHAPKPIPSGVPDRRRIPAPGAGVLPRWHGPEREIEVHMMDEVGSVRFRLRRVPRQVAARAVKRPTTMFGVERAGARPLGPVFAQHLLLVFRQELPPVGVGLRHFECRLGRAPLGLLVGTSRARRERDGSRAQHREKRPSVHNCLVLTT